MSPNMGLTAQQKLSNGDLSLLVSEYHSHVPQLQLSPSQTSDTQLHFISRNLRKRNTVQESGVGVGRGRVGQ